MKRGTKINAEEKRLIIIGVMMFKRSYNSFAKEFNCSFTAIRNVVENYKKSENPNLGVSMGHKDEAYWQNEWCYATGYNPFSELRYSHVVKEEKPEKDFKSLLVEI